MDLQAALDALDGYPVLCAYNANVDGIRRVDADLESVLGPPGDDPDGRLDSRSELAAAIAATMNRGSGDERAMTDAFAADLESSLAADEQRLGGQAGIMADVLSSLGGSPVFYTYLLSGRQRAQFTHPDGIRFPVAEGDEEGGEGELVLRRLEDAPPAEKTKLNWIFEFDAGDTFFGTTAADASRFIAASRPDEFDLHTSVDGHAETLGERVGCAVLSGFHSVNREYESGETFETCLDNAASFVRGVGDHARVQVELGVTHDPAIREKMREAIVPEADVVSLDGRELDQLRDDLGVSVPTTEDGIVRRYETLEAVREQLEIGALSFHAKSYFLATFDDRYLPPAAVRDGFDVAAYVAAAKAEDGLVTGADDLGAATRFERSAKGIDAVDRLADALDVPCEDGVVASPGVVAVPNRVVETPASTVGIGDSVSVTSFALANAVAEER
ncbi:phosphofructokinase [Salinigranum rubrum]|uniref:Phosphofructokinase n=1 Tax=Salinigranum rubrum TaxID=755307 RepID=A0A2I8VNP7_9EURY|nr:ADP-dependent glucokinase/phosphofructokinase [Salinigranum rubrum]AUV83543.1 phosphofructokinase [Salinigranum rubrum]